VTLRSTHRTLRALLPCLSLLAASSATATAGTRYVDVNQVSGANSGASWADAYQGVDGLVNALTAAVAGDQIWVAQGTYKPTATATRSIYITLKSGVEIYGGFNATETLLAQRNVTANPTILSGDLSNNDGSSIFTDNSFHVINANSVNATSILDGFTVRGGNANGVSASNQDKGGGILCLAASNPTVRNCVFVANRCTFGGGAGYINSSSPSFSDTRFENNVGGSFGGAFDMATSVAATFERCVFSGNSAARAGAIEIFGSSPVKVQNSLFFNNTVTGTGGGGAIFISSSNPLIKNCTIVGNFATATASAGILGSGSPAIANCIVWGNTGPGGAQAQANQISPGTLSVTYSCVMTGYTGAGNIATNPALVNVGGNDYQLTLTSPCIDAGNNAAVPAGSLLDLALAPRFADEPATADTGSGSAPVVDMGAYEVRSPIVSTYCFGDGFGTACPCGNNSAAFADEGCMNSLGLGGKLNWSGSARIAGDTFVLNGVQMTNSSCLYFQGTAQVNLGNGTVFGDGLRCAGGSVLRLGTKFNVAGASLYPVGADLPVSVKGLVTTAGSVRTYQVWYRNAAAFCAPETFNLTSALQVTWEL
jgi:hypothetical protein